MNAAPVTSIPRRHVGPDDLAVGSVLTHTAYGEGTIVRHGSDGAVVMDFPGVGEKSLIARFAPLTLVSKGGPAITVEDAERFDKDVREALRDMQVRKAAADLLKAQQAPDGLPFDADFLGAILARPAPPPMRVEGPIPSEAGTLVVASRKTGKTTFELNLARSFLTGEPLLGRFDVRPVDGIVALLNYEVSADTAGRWADEAGLDHDRFLLVNLRGRHNPLAFDEDRELLAARLKSHGTEAVIVDPFGRAYNGKSQNDAGEVGQWLVSLDTFARSEAGATDLILTAHAGWNGERTRGASALEDWADVIITMTRDADDEGQRFIRAIGRDVELDEDRLDFHQPTRTLTLAGTGSRQQAKTNRQLVELSVLVLRAAREHPGSGVKALEG